jgi:hypothetical protein
LHGAKDNWKAGPRATFLKVEPAPADRIADRCPVRRNLDSALASAWEFACFSVANLDAGPVPSIPVPYGIASRPVAGRFIDGSGRYVDGSWFIVAGASCRRSKQRTNCQATNNARSYVPTIPCNRKPGGSHQTACDQQSDQKLSHFDTLREGHYCLRRLKAKLTSPLPRHSMVVDSAERWPNSLVDRIYHLVPSFGGTYRHRRLLRGGPMLTSSSA